MANHKHGANAQIFSKLEQGLKALGYDVSPDGKLSASDVRHIKRFYADKLPDQKFVSKKQLRTDLETVIVEATEGLIDRPRLTPYETGKLQQRLQWLGLYEGKIDKDIGRRTKKAMDAFNERYRAGEEPVVVESKEISSPPLSSKNITVVLDAGHGFWQHGKYDCGAERSNIYEADIVMAQAKVVKAELESRGIKVVLTRDHDFDKNDAADDRHVKTFKTQTDSLNHRVKIAQKQAKHDDVIFISLHADAADNKQAHGIRVHHTPGDTKSADFAKMLVNEFNNGESNDKDAVQHDFKAIIKESKLHVLKYNPVEALLIETGFMTNKKDLARIMSKEDRDNLAEQIADAVENYHPIPHPHKPKHHHGKNHHLRNH
jgi:N-acetylmuramoyl-L-alanine amidase